MADIVVYGTGGFAREVHQLIEDVAADGQPWNFLGFLDDDVQKQGKEVHGFPVLGGREWLVEHDVGVAMGVGDTTSRRRLVTSLPGGMSFPPLVHPLAWLGKRIELGTGTLVCAGSLLTTDLRLARHVIVNLDCTIGHDAAVGDFVTLAPSVNVSGNVTIHEGVDIGTGASVNQGLSIGEWSVVGASAAVVADIPANVTAVGVPARIIKERPPGWHLEEA